MVIVAIADITAFGIYMGFWFPDVPQWIWVLGVVAIICGLNLCHVKVFGEPESSAEVAALKFKVPLWPVAPALTIAFMGFVIVMLGWFDDTRVALYVGAAWLALLAAVFYIRIRPKFAAASR